MKENKNNIPKGYKQSAVGVIPEEWAVKKLSKVAEIDKSSLDTKTDENLTINYISLSDVESNSYTSSPIKYSKAPSRAKRIVSDGDILMATVRPNLKGFTIVKKPQSNTIASTGFAVITTKRANNLYVYYNLFGLNIEKQLYQLIVGSNYPAINSSDVKNLKIPLPPLPEQKKIAEILSKWDLAIEKCDAAISALKKRNKGLAQQLLKSPLPGGDLGVGPAEGKPLRLKGFEGEWKEVQLGDIAERITRKNKELNDTVVTISAQRGFVKQEDFFNKRVASKTLTNYYLLKKGEFAYNKSYSKDYPMGAFKRLDKFDKAVVTTLYICFKLKQGVDANFIQQYFERGLLIRGLMKIAQEGGRAHGLLNISLSDFFNLTLFIPPIEEQKAISNLLQQSDRELELQIAKRDALQEQKKGLMQKLLTGEVRVNNI